MSRTTRRLLLSAMLALPALLATCKKSEEPKVPTSIVITPSSVTLTALFATQQLAAVVNDQNGNTMAGQVVTWSGGGTAASVSATGLVTALANGTATVTATSGSLSQNVTVTVAQAGSALAAYLGNNQIGLVGWGVNVRPAVRVTDAGGSPVSGTSVTFAVASGGGSVTGGVATSNASGIAQVGKWALGTSPGVNTMTATITGGTAQVTIADTGYAAGYTITLVNYGATPPAAAQVAFDSAQAKWQRLIYRPLTIVQVTDAGNTCSAKEPAGTWTTTGLIIYWAVDSIDGPGKVLAQAGPCLIRTSNGLTALGIMKFDSADIGSLIASGTLSSVVLHEMGHVIGFGTLWNTGPNTWLQLPSSPPTTINDTYFSGPKGRAAFDSVGGTSYTGGGSSPPAGNKVPVENCGTSPYVSPNCGTGTVNGHWREVVMTNELMTGYINAGANPLSIVSVAAQEDLGYVVNYSAADTYTHTFTAPVVGGTGPIWLGDDILRVPIQVIDAGGNVIRVIQPR